MWIALPARGQLAWWHGDWRLVFGSRVQGLVPPEKNHWCIPFTEPGSVVDAEVWFADDTVGNLPQEINEFASYF